MEKINLNENDNLEDEDETKKSKPSDFILSNPLKTEIIKFNIKNGELEYEIQILYKSEKWRLIKKLSEIVNLVKILKTESFSFLNESYFKNLQYDLDLNNSNKIREINSNVLNLLNYINYRYDVLLNSNTKEFFKINNFSFNQELTQTLQAENLQQIYNFKIEDSDMTLSDFSYDPDLGLLILGLEDISILSTIGRFWSLIDYEILGSILFYQRVYDKNDKPFFRKIVNKNFDARVSKIEICIEKNIVYVGLDNGTIQVFNVNMIEKNKKKNIYNKIENNKNNLSVTENTIKEINLDSTQENNKNISEEEDKFIVINEGIIFKPLNERITGLALFKKFLFISSKDNKLVILDIENNKPELKFNGSLKKRMEGKGHIKQIFIDKKTKNLFVITATDKVLIYKLCLTTNLKDDSSIVDIKIEFLNEINTVDNIKNYFLGNYNLFLATENKIQVCDIKKIKDFSNNLNSKIGEEANIIPFDGSLDEGISVSSKFLQLEYSQGNYITSMSYFCDMKLIVLGLSSGILVALSSKSLEVMFSMKISEYSLNKMILLEENYVVLISDEKGNIFFYKFGL